MRCSSVLVRWVVGSTPHGGPTDISRLCQCSMTDVTKPWYVLSCLLDGVYKRTLATFLPVLFQILIVIILFAELFTLYPLSYFSFQPVLHDWCNKGRGMCYPVCGMVHIKEPLLLIDKSSLCGGSGFPFSLSEWSLTICLTPYNRR